MIDWLDGWWRRDGLVDGIDGRDGWSPILICTAVAFYLSDGLGLSEYCCVLFFYSSFSLIFFAWTFVQKKPKNGGGFPFFFSFTSRREFLQTAFAHFRRLSWTSGQVYAWRMAVMIFSAYFMLLVNYNDNYDHDDDGGHGALEHYRRQHSDGFHMVSVALSRILSSIHGDQ